MSRRIDQEDVGKFFLGPDGEVWRLISYASQPTATFERLDRRPFQLDASPTRTGGVVGSPILSDFRRLVPETD